jgi:AcrR family transcriptional regulator
VSKEASPVGRPRSEHAREAVLHAVDDLLLETGYAAMTMKGIAERAGVGRQTVYRWWSTKAEILFEASVIDAEEELSIPATGDVTSDVVAYVEALKAFLAQSPAGAAYRALLGEAQHDKEVAALVATKDVVLDSARGVLERALAKQGLNADGLDQAAALLIGPPFFWILSGRDPALISSRDVARVALLELA